LKTDPKLKTDFFPKVVPFLFISQIFLRNEFGRKTVPLLLFEIQLLAQNNQYCTTIEVKLKEMVKNQISWRIFVCLAL
jgi:hypothetical protein